MFQTCLQKQVSIFKATHFHPLISMTDSKQYDGDDDEYSTGELVADVF